MNKNNLPIGIFDSGVGGLTVLKELCKFLPREQFIYFGDTANVPYGNKSKETITKNCIKIVDFLNKQKVKLIIVACNTASSTALSQIKKHTQTPVIDVVSPCVIQAIKTTKNQLIGIIGTKTTIDSKAYFKKIKEHDKKINVFSQACPLFVPIIEEALHNHKIAQEATKLYLKKLPNTIDTLILGCTHYPLMKKTIMTHCNKHTRILDSAIIVSEYVKFFLYKTKLTTSQTKDKTDKFYVSDDPQKFKKALITIMSINTNKIKKIQLK